jgi:two-component system, NarL family, response regulator DevR
MASNPTITILLVEDHAMVAAGLAELLRLHDDLEVVAVVGTVADARAAVAAHHPAVVLMDYRLPDGDGASATRELLELVPPPAVVMLSAASDAALLDQAVEAGCTGFVAKHASADELVRAVRAAAAGEPHFSADVLVRLLQLRRDRVAHPGPELSDREREVLQLTADGVSVAAIATQLDLSVHTVRNHIRRALQRLDAHTKLDAVVVAARLGLITIAPEPR